MGQGIADWKQTARWYADGQGPLETQLPYIRGRWFFVDPQSGISTADGRDESPMDNIVTAYDACKTGRGDGICLLSSGVTTAYCTSYLTAALDWAKWGITVFGVCAPTLYGQRARVANKSTALNLAYMIDVQGSNNAFYNMSIYNGGTTGIGGVKVTGQRNYFGNVNMMGGMGMTVPTIADYSLRLSGGDENTFVDCVLGNDTFDKGDLAAAELIVDGGCMRNRFIGCEFNSWRSAGTTAGMVLLNGGDAITRHMLFKDCSFLMYRLGSAAAEAAVVIGTIPNNGFVMFKDCTAVGFVDYGKSFTNRCFSNAVTPVESACSMVLTGTA